MAWIVTDNISAATWRRLLEFANLDLAMDAISRVHGTATTRQQLENYEKQARQVRLCALQAKEYFDAAAASSLFTSPNHLYYGCISLASLCMLVLGDGRMSLDYLRRDNRNNHHGLDFTTGCNAKSAAKDFSLLTQCRVEYLSHGHFSNWYSILPNVARTYCIATQHRQLGVSSVSRDLAGTMPIRAFNEIQGTKALLLEQMKRLPDLDDDLRRFGVDTASCRVKHEVHHDNGLTTHVWAVFKARDLDELMRIFEGFKVRPEYAEAITFDEGSDGTHGLVRITVEKPRPGMFSWPDSRETMSHDSVMFADPIDTHEVVDLYTIAYQLSMLSRYFPDIWISCMESQCRAAKLIERAVEVIAKKLPILVLGLVLREEMTITTHRESWAP